MSTETSEAMLSCGRRSVSNKASSVGTLMGITDADTGSAVSSLEEEMPDQYRMRHGPFRAAIYLDLQLGEQF